MNRPSTDYLASPESEPAFFVVTSRDPVYTAGAIPTSDLIRMGYGVDEPLRHGDQGLYLGGNLCGHLFLDRDQLLEYVAAYTPSATQIPCEFLAWGIL
ncbi:hypothetical protein ABH908_000162 [Pseudomonas frederiksbergensis]|uniref:hypothetical protein n=1 Tax=Pseudomonas TaxID=286 RepID=UPI003D19D889